MIDKNVVTRIVDEWLEGKDYFLVDVTVSPDEGVYNIELTNSFAGDSIAVYLNDSLLLDQTMPDANLKVEIKRFAEDNVLMVVDNKTDKTTPFNLNPEGSRVEVKKSGDVIYILEREADSLLE